MKLYKREKITDERVVNIQNKIYKEVFQLAIAISILSIIIKFYLYGLNSELVITEFIIIIIPSFFYTVRTIWLGIYSDEIELHDRTSKIPMSIKQVFVGLVTGIAIAMFFGVRSSLLYGNESNRL